MRAVIGSRMWVLSCGAALALASAALVESMLCPRPTASAQISNGDFWIRQPGTTGVVGRSWSNSDRSVEYWAYVVGTYAFADTSNVSTNLWHIEAEIAGTTSYGSFAQFQSAVLAMPEFQGKTILFQHHTVVEETIEN